MKNKNLSSIVALSVLFMSSMLAPKAQALVHLSLMAGPNQFRPSQSAGGIAISTTPKIGYEAGASVAMSIFPFFEAEIGAFYAKDSMESKVVVANAGSLAGANFGLTAITVDEMTRASVPLMVRFTGLPFIDLAAGGYFSRSLGKIVGTESVQATDSNGATISSISYTKDSERDYDSSTLSRNDFGAIASVRAYAEVMPLTKVFVDARYMHGFTNRSAVAGADFKTRTISVLGGMAFGF